MKAGNCADSLERGHRASWHTGAQPAQHLRAAKALKQPRRVPPRCPMRPLGLSLAGGVCQGTVDFVEFERWRWTIGSHLAAPNLNQPLAQPQRPPSRCLTLNQRMQKFVAQNRDQQLALRQGRKRLRPNPIALSKRRYPARSQRRAAKGRCRAEGADRDWLSRQQAGAAFRLGQRLVQPGQISTVGGAEGFKQKALSAQALPALACSLVRGRG